MISSDALLIQKQLFTDCGFACTSPKAEPESAAYSACEFEARAVSTSAERPAFQRIKFRLAKITPTKIGQFVTLWKREAPGSPIKPSDAADGIDLIIVAPRSAENFGAFVFPAATIIKIGKLAIRVYPPWDKPTSPQALRTQKWQAPYFTILPPNE